MKLLRRIVSAVTLAGAVAAVFRVRGSGGTPPQHGGWRPLPLPPEGEADHDPGPASPTDAPS